MIEFDFDTQSVSAEWLTQILTQNGYLETGIVESVEQEASKVHTGASASFHQLTLKYSSGSTGTRPKTFLIKIAISGDVGALEEILIRYSAWLFLPQSHRYSILQKEPIFYESVRRAATPLPLIRCYGSAIDTVGHNMCLLLEDISDSHEQTTWPITPNYDQCDAAVTALARLHAHWWNNVSFGNEDFPLVTSQLVDEVSAVFRDAYNKFEDELGDGLSDYQRVIYEKSLNKLPILLKERLVGSSQLTLAHGDAHFWNMLIPKSGGDLVIFDWQTWHVDIGAHDLAYLMGVGWYSEHRDIREKKLLGRYLGELNKRGIQYEWNELLFDYRLSIIRHLFTPVIFSSFIKPLIWWHHLHRIFSTFEDWKCEDLLD